VKLPPAFPKFEAWRHTGRLPSPAPLVMPPYYH
jgi:hypothetical protein